MPVSKQKLGKVGGSLEVPFRSSLSSFNELSCDGDGTSRGSREDMNNSAHSIPLCDGSDNLDGFQLSDADRQEQMEQRTKLTCNFGSLDGAEKYTPFAENTCYGSSSNGNKRDSETQGRKRFGSKFITETTKKLEEASISFRIGGNGKAENGSEIPTQSLPSNQEEDDFEADEEAENDIGSNPQGEDSNDDDPFSTWSAPGDPKRKQPEQNWLQRGLGGRGRDNTARNSRQPPPNEMIEDPFDSCNDSQSNDNNVSLDGSEKYTSFGSSSQGNNRDSEMQGRKRFGLFKGMIGGGRR